MFSGRDAAERLIGASPTGVGAGLLPVLPYRPDRHQLRCFEQEAELNRGEALYWPNAIYSLNYR